MDGCTRRVVRYMTRRGLETQNFDLDHPAVDPETRSIVTE